jgi:hypothetical protein
LGRALNLYGGGSTGSSLALEANNGAEFCTIYSGPTAADPTSIFSKSGFKFGIATAKDATGFSEKMRLTSAGLLGLGTSGPAAKLDVWPASSSDAAFRGNAGVSTQVPAFEFRGYNTNSTNGGLDIRTNLNGTFGDKLRITNDGLVGIGTTGPSQKLQIATGNVQIDSNYGFIWDNSTTGIYGNSSPSVLQFYTGNAERMRLTSTGLGIGITSPSKLLHVQSGSVTGSARGGAFTKTLFESSDATATYWELQAASTATNDFIFSKGNTGSYGIVGYDHATDALRFFANSAERVRITSAGNVGIGTTGPSQKLDVIGNIQVGDTGNERGIYVGAAGFSGAFLYQPSGDVQLSPRSGYGIKFAPAPGSATEWGRWDSSGRLLVGTSSAISTINYAGADRTPRLQVVGDDVSNGSFAIIRTQTAPVLFFGGGTSGTNVASGSGIGSIVFTGYHTNKYYTGATIDAGVDGTPGADDMPCRLVFSTTADGAASPTERMRIKSTGEILAGGRTAYTSFGTDGLYIGSGGELFTSYTSGTVAGFNRNGSDGTVINFGKTGTVVGTISVTGSATAYNTSSDYRLKENVTAVTDGITRLLQLKPSRFNFIAEPDKTVDGFLAHEAQAVVPECVFGAKDAVDDDGNPVMQGIDQSKLVPLLTAALQEAIAKIEALETRLSALEAA